MFQLSNIWDSSLNKAFMYAILLSIFYLCIIYFMCILRVLHIQMFSLFTFASTVYCFFDYFFFLLFTNLILYLAHALFTDASCFCTIPFAAVTLQTAPLWEHYLILSYHNRLQTEKHCNI